MTPYLQRDIKVKEKMKILMILSNPFITDPRVNKEAKTLVDAGNEVTIIVWDRHKDYESKSMVDGIKIVRIHNKGLMKILSHDLFKNPLWWRKAYKKGLELYKNDFKFDVVHCHDLDTLKSGVWLKKKLGIKLIYDAHEIFGYMIEKNVPTFMVNATFRMEKRLLRYVDRIITVNEPCKDYFKSITDKPITIVINCKNFISKQYHPPKNDIFTISYIGSLDKARMFPELVDIIGNIGRVKFIIISKKENLYKEVKKRCESYKNVEFLDSIPYKEVIKKTFESNVVICMFDPNSKSHQVGLPNKIFEAMVTARPIIVTKNMYYSNEFVDKEKCGLSVNNNCDEVREALIKLRDNPKLCEKLGKNGQKAAKDRYNWEMQSLKLLNVYDDIQHSN